jgi:predicted dehydrogenase
MCRPEINEIARALTCLSFPSKFRIMHTFNINRRLFLKGATASLALATLGANGMDIVNPVRNYRVALIGSGWYGKSDLLRLMQVSPVEVVALCDVDKNMLTQAGAKVKERAKLSKTPPLYADYRKMLAEQKPDIVLVGTPDHWHALNAIEAIKSGAHVYLQKPVSVDVRESEAILAAAQKFNRTVQVGLQRRSTPHWVEAKTNVIEAGLLGKVSHVEMFCYYHMRMNSKPPVTAVPDFLDYEMWTGPAPMRPYDGLPHRRWRAFREYGNGIVGDMCVHMFDGARWLLGLGWPKRITSSGGVYVQKQSSSTISDTQTAVFEYPELNCVWQHRTWGNPADPDYPWALKIYGEKGMLSIDTLKYDFVPLDGSKVHKDALYEREKFPEDTREEGIEIHAAPATRRHMMNFLKAIEEKSKPVADIEEGYISTASCILANLSMDLGRPIVYDPQTKQVVNDSEATARLKRDYRGPWERP